MNATLTRARTPQLALVSPAESTRHRRRGAPGFTDIQVAFEAVSMHVEATVRGFLQGRLREMCLEHLGTGGKRVRARIALQAAVAMQIDPATVIPIAAACELLHNATLIHDDLQDGDTVRRGRPALWVRHGAAHAINAGDALLMLPTLALEVSALSHEVRWHVARAVAARCAATAIGQAADLDDHTEQTLGWDRWTDVALGKSGPFFALPIEAVALAAGRPAAVARALGDTATVLGVLFQLRDDVLDLYGDKGRGATGNDLREGKVSALVVAHLERRPEDTGALLALLDTPRSATTAADVEIWARRFVHSGSLAAVVALAAAHVDRLREDPVLAREPALRELVLALAAQLTDPLASSLAE